MMNDDIKRGQRLVITAIAIALAVSLIVSVFTNVVGTANPIQQVIRLALTGLLCYFVYQGKNWARWTLGILIGLGCLTAIVSGLVLFSQSIGGGLFLLIVGGLYFLCAKILLLTPDVQAFQEYQRARHVS